MYTRLNPNQRHHIQSEGNRQGQIEMLEAQLRKASKQVSFWKSCLCVCVVVFALVAALK